MRRSMRMIPLCARENHGLRTNTVEACAYLAHSLRKMKLQATNLSLPETLVDVAKEYVKERKKANRGFSVSILVTGLLVSHLRSKGVKLPKEFVLK